MKKIFIEAAEAAGFVSEKLLQSEDNPVVTHLFQYKPAVYQARKL